MLIYAPLITAFISFVTAVLVALMGRWSSARTEKIKTNYTFLNWKLQKLQDSLEVILPSPNVNPSSEIKDGQELYNLTLDAIWKSTIPLERCFDVVSHLCNSSESSKSKKEFTCLKNKSIDFLLDKSTDSYKNAKDFAKTSNDMRIVLREMLINEIVHTLRKLGE